MCNKYQTVDKLLQFYLFIPAREKVSVLCSASICYCAAFAVVSEINQQALQLFSIHNAD